MWISCRTSGGLVSTNRGYKLRKYTYVCSSGPKNENKNNEFFFHEAYLL